MINQDEVAIVGGCGRVGLPLGIALASRGLTVTLYDRNEQTVETVNSGQLPFREEGAEELLVELTGEGRVLATPDPIWISSAGTVIIVVGTPLDEHFNPELSAITDVIAELRGYFRDGQLLILRSTVYPGTTARVARQVEEYGLRMDVAFCPERIAEGKAMTELFSLPQIVAANDQDALARAEKFFRVLTDQAIIRLDTEEAELAKLITNAWRYIQFAAANQFWTLANDMGVDYEMVRRAIILDYPRAASLPGAGFAAGPCLLKDTMQLASFAANNFPLGNAAMLVNEGLPLYIVSQLKRAYQLDGLTVGILGMAFKPGSDDPRDSLAYKLRKILQFEVREVLCTDPHVQDDRLVSLDEVLERSNLLIVGCPHPEYDRIESGLDIINVWSGEQV